MASSLRPASSINDLRTQAHLALSARLQNLDLTPVLVRTLGSNLPESILPYMIWEYDMSVPAVPMQALGVSLQTILQNAIPLHQKLGTPWALKQALSLCGFTNVTIQEGQSSWGGNSYPASQGWAVFRVVLNSGATGEIISGQMTGSANGTNTAFSIPLIASPTTSLRAFYNGLLLRPTIDYSVNGSSVTTNFVPDNNSKVSAAFRGTSAQGAVQSLTQIINFFKPARSVLDSIPLAFPQFFDGTTPTVSGSNLILPQAPTSLEIYRNGFYMTQDVDFTLSGATVTPTAALGSDVFVAFGTYGTATGTPPNFADYVTPTGVMNGSNVTFTLPNTPNPALSLKLYKGYQLLKQGLDYSLSGATITYSVAPTARDVHSAFYRY